jgi:AraC-like DNA-binding protein
MRTLLVHITSILFLLFALTTVAQAESREEAYFFTLTHRNGMLDDNVLQMLQLPDDRMAIMTNEGINIYGDRTFKTVRLDTTLYTPISNYRGQTHLYVDRQSVLWIKIKGKVCCLNLQTLHWIRQPFRQFKLPRQPQDVFVDHNRQVWLVADNYLMSADGKARIPLNPSFGNLQDMDVLHNMVYTFYGSGKIGVADISTGKTTETLSTYPENVAGKYSSTSLVAKSIDNKFYQIRTGKGGSVFLCFNPQTRKVKELFHCSYLLHTLNVASANEILISTQHGYLLFNLNISERPREITQLSLPDGTSLSTGINTVYRDHDGGIWLGTYHNGIIYVSPYLGLFFQPEKHYGKTIAIVVVSVVVILLILLIIRKKRKVKISSESASSQTASSEPFSSDSAEQELLQKARTLIEQHLSDSSYGVEQLAADLCMERTGLYKKIVALTGDKPVNFIKDIRLKQAATLLRDGRLSINEIALQTGFSSPSYFTKCFKSHFGVKPSEYTDFTNPIKKSTL